MLKLLVFSLLLFSCGETPTVPGQPLYSYYLVNSNGGDFRVIFIDEYGEQQIGWVRSPWIYEFYSHRKKYYLKAIGTKSGNTRAEFRVNDKMVHAVHCLCWTPILKLEWEIKHLH